MLQGDGKLCGYSAGDDTKFATVQAAFISACSDANSHWKLHALDGTPGGDGLLKVRPTRMHVQREREREKLGKKELTAVSTYSPTDCAVPFWLRFFLVELNGYFPTSLSRSLARSRSLSCLPQVVPNTAAQGCSVTGAWLWVAVITSIGCFFLCGALHAVFPRYGPRGLQRGRCVQTRLKEFLVIPALFLQVGG